MAPFTSAIFGPVVVAVGIVTAVFQFGLSWWMQTGDRNQVCESDAGSLCDQVHLPSQCGGTAPPSVIMALHGYSMTRYGWNSIKATTQLNHLTNREGFIIVFSTQRRNRAPAWGS